LRHRVLMPALFLSLISAASAQAELPAPPADLTGISFLVGTWESGDGRVAETGGTSRGSSKITAEAGGSALLRRDHTDLFGADGKATGSFDQIMLIYREGRAIHADYTDGAHVIHYTSAVVVPGRSVAFTTSTIATAPTFRLSYEKTADQTLALRFEIAPPGQTEFHAIATGTLHKGT